MSEPTTATAPPRGKGKKILGMSQGQLLIVLGVALAGGAFLLWRKHKASQQAQQAPAAGTCPDGSQPDASGNCVQSGQDWSGAIATLQTEIADLQGAMAGGGAGAGGGGGPVGQPNPFPPPVPVPNPPGGTPPPPGGGGKAAGPISNLRVTGYNQTGVSFAWNPATGATQGYAWGVSGNGITKKGNTTATHVSVTGLTKPGVYNFGIQALPGGPGNNIHTPPLKGA